MEKYKYFLTCSIIIKNEQTYIQEWIDHYIYHGVEHFFIIDNGSTDNTFNILKKYKNITYFHDTRKYPDKQPDMYTDNLLLYLKKYVKWNILVDADELIHTNHGFTIHSYLKTIPDNIHQIYVIWKMFFGTDNNNTKMKNITTRFNYDYLHPKGGKKAFPQFFKDCGPMGRQPGDPCYHRDGCVNLMYFLCFGKSIFRPDKLSQNVIWIHKQQVIGNTITNFHTPLPPNAPDTCVPFSSQFNEDNLQKCGIFLNHYFLKNKNEYNKRTNNTIYNTSEQLHPFHAPKNYKKSHWDYIKFIKELYNMDPAFLITEPKISFDNDL
jgi:glycosyltransferase involved in cell wall biosynthesis